MNDEEATYKNQEQFGRAYEEDEFLIFNVAVRYPETIVSIKNNIKNLYIINSSNKRMIN